MRRMVFTPTPHVITLFDTAEHYPSGSFVQTVRDSYYREYLSNGIPRERIYEIWSNTPQVKRGTTHPATEHGHYAVLGRVGQAVQGA